MCRSHYRRWNKYGDPLAGGPKLHVRQKWIDDHVNYQGDECLRWPFSYGRGGRGQMKLNGHHTTASRAMCAAAHGPAPQSGMHAAHSCGNGNQGCVNPKHLRWATPTENAHDNVILGAVVRGTRQGTARMNAVDILGVRLMAKSQPHKVAAAEFGLARQYVGKIMRKETWRVL